MSEPRVLVVHHSADGHTAEVAARIAEVIRKAGAVVEMSDATEAAGPAGYDGVVLGDSIHAGHHSRALRHYLTRHLGELREMPTALFQVSLTSAKSDEKSAAEARGYVDTLLTSTGFDPDVVGQFAGAVVYTRYGWLKRRMMRRIMAHEGSDTDTTRDYDYTDWGAVEGFAEDAYALIAGRNSNPASGEEDAAIRELTPAATAQVGVTTAPDGIGEAFGSALGRLMTVLSQRGIAPTGPPFARYLDVSDPNGWRVAVGVPVAAPVEGTDEVHAGELPGGRAAVLMHRGRYDGLRDAWTAMEEWARHEGVQATGAPWESYLVSPNDVADDSQLRTEIVWPIG